MENYDVIIVGAGSGGIAAALSAAGLGLKVCLLEKQNFIGGNAAQSGVSVWEMGVGGTGIPFDIYKSLKTIPNAIGIYSFGKHQKWQLKKGETPVFPGAEILIDKSLRYKDTLLRHGSEIGIANEDFVRKYWHGVPFEPSIYQEKVEELMQETNLISLLKNTTVVSVEAGNGWVKNVTLDNKSQLQAPFFIDATDNGFLCEKAGSKMMYGQEAKNVFDEPGAPEVATKKINGVSLIYRISKTSNAAAITEKPVCWWAKQFPVASIVQYPNGDFNVNMLPTMEGIEFVEIADYAKAYEECNARVHAHFQYLRITNPQFNAYEIVWIAPSLGVREGKRVIGEYILTEKDIRAGLSHQTEQKIVTIADHALDTHGESTLRAGSSELAQPYGVPYECLIPKSFKNVLIASRAASFSSLAASSCRLSRTMMQLGQAAAAAIYLAKQLGCELKEVPYKELRSLLLSQHVQLDFPAPIELKQYLENE